MGKAWPIGPNDEPVGWFEESLKDDGSGEYAVKPPYQPLAPRWIRASVLGWVAFFFAAYWWSERLVWGAFFIASALFVIAGYTTYRAARFHIDDLVRTAWEEVVQRPKFPTR